MSNKIEDMIGHYIALSFKGQKLPEVQITEISRAYVGGLAASLVFFGEILNLSDKEFLNAVKKHSDEIMDYYKNA